MQRCSLWMVLRFLLSAAFLPLNAKSTDLFTVFFTSLEAAQTSKMISVLVSSNTLLMILSQWSIWSWSGVNKEMSLSSSPKSSYVLSWMNAGQRRKDEFPYEGAAQEINQVSRFSWIVWSTINSLNGIFSGFLCYFFSEKWIRQTAEYLLNWTIWKILANPYLR